MPAAPTLTVERLRELLHYEPTTGIFTWKTTRSRTAHEGTAAGGMKKGYLVIGIDGRYFSAHRLAWFYVTGSWPVGDIDHRDTDKQNNRWTNLRDVTEHMNMQNQQRAHCTNKCGLLGVSPNGKKWQAQIRIGGREAYLGTFDTPEQAHARYLEAKRQHHAGCTI